MITRLLLSALTLVFTMSAFAAPANDMYAYLRVSLETDNLASDPVAAKKILRDFMENSGSVEAGIGALKNKKARAALGKIVSEMRSMTPYGAKAALENALMEAYEGEENSASVVADELMASMVAHQAMWSTFSRWMVSNSQMICPAHYSSSQCESFRE